MAEYIERERLLKIAYKLSKGSFSTPLIISSIEKAPKADAVEVKHGEWIEKSTCVHQCSLCDGVAFLDFKGKPCKYCPSCGAKMDLKEGAEE